MINFPNEQAKWIWLGGLMDADGCIDACMHDGKYHGHSRDKIEKMLKME